MRKNPLDLISSSDKVTIDKFKHDIYEIKAYRKIYIDLDVYSVKAWLSGLLKASDINRYVEEKMGKSRNRMCKECFHSREYMPNCTHIDPICKINRTNYDDYGKYDYGAYNYGN